MSSAVQALLSSQGPMPSADLAKRLEATGVTAVNARKLIQRASGAVSRLSGVRFPRNEQFLYIGDDFGSSKFWKSLLKAFDARSSVYGWAANALIARSGAIPSYQFNIISGAPLRMKGQVSAESIRQRFEQIRFLSSTTLKDLGPCFLINPAVDDQLPDNPFSALRARLLAEEILLDALRDWVRKLGLGSYNRVEIRSSQLTPSFGQFCWDLVAPSYIPPFARFSGDGKLQPGFIVCDAVLGVELSKPQVGYFIRKVSTLRQNRKIRPFLAMLIAEHFSQEAFSALKQNGIVATQPSALFGQTVGRALRTLLSTLSNAAAAAAANPEVVSILFKDLSSIEGAAGNLRGPLFELVVGHFAKRQGSYIELSKRVRDSEDGREAEIDVFANSTDLVTAYECRGHVNASVQLADVERWLTRTLPILRAHMLASTELRAKKLKGEFWTTSTFAPDAEAHLRERQSQLTKYEISWLDGPAIREMLSRTRESRLREILDEHFFHHPLSE